MSQKSPMTATEANLLRVLRVLVSRVENEVDLDACSTELGRAMTNAQDWIDRLSETRRNDAFMDQSKW